VTACGPSHVITSNTPTIRITGNYHSGEDSLGIAAGYTLPSGVTAAWNGSTQTLTISGSATKVQYDAILEHVTYTNSSDSPNHDPRTLSWTVNDGTSNSVTKSSTITITGTVTNHAPTVEAPIPDVTKDEDASDTVFSLYPHFQDTEDADNQLTYTVANNTNSGLFSVVNIDGSGNVNLDYAPDKDGEAFITIRATDTGGLWVEDTFHVTVNAEINNNPTVEAPIPDVTVNEDAADTVFSLYPYFQDVEDTDADLFYQVTGNTNEALFTSVNISDPTHFRLDYAANASGVADITIRATDSDGLWVEDTFRVTVNPVNDAPVNTVPDSITAMVNTLTPITGISISDADAGSSVVQVTLGATHGTLQVGSTVAGGLTAGQISGNGTSSVVLNGTLAQIDATLADVSGLQYQSALNYTGADTLTVSTNDLGATGSGGVLTTISTVPMTVSPWTLESESTGWATDYWRHAEGVGGYDVLFAYNTATGQYYQYEGYSASPYGDDSNFWRTIGDPGIVAAGTLLDGNVHALKADGSITFQFDSVQHREYYTSTLLGQFYYDFDHGAADGLWYQKVGAGATDWAQAGETEQVWFQYGPDPNHWNLGNGFEYEYSTYYATSYWRHPGGSGGYDTLFAYAPSIGQWYQYEGSSGSPYGIDSHHWYALGAAGALGTNYGLLDGNAHQVTAGLTFSFDGIQHRAYWTSDLLGQFYYDYDHAVGDGLWYQYQSGSATWLSANETEQVWFQYGPDPNHWTLGSGFEYEYSTYYSTSYWRDPIGGPTYTVLYAYNASTGQWYEQTTPTTSWCGDGGCWVTIASRPTAIG